MWVSLRSEDVESGRGEARAKEVSKRIRRKDSILTLVTTVLRSSVALL